MFWDKILEATLKNNPRNFLSKSGVENPAILRVHHEDEFGAPD